MEEVGSSETFVSIRLRRHVPEDTSLSAPRVLNGHVPVFSSALPGRGKNITGKIRFLFHPFTLMFKANFSGHNKQYYVTSVVGTVLLNNESLKDSNSFTTKRFLKELIAFFPFSIISVFDTKSGMKNLKCMHNEVDKRTQFDRLQCWYY
jgi:hypothetical protein